ncbi:PIN-like domain-containing protein [Pseudomonas sp. AG1028]|uniref:PIN-like domain-containing protein n=1 Tax=Pseudomonas sp. AG1028 TaxID=2572911 RepID=UPI0011BDD766|nr:PIN domain-containing protein [Pseudomonas sp. AG1028]
MDANVLLDLYRYHESTRNSLIQSIQNFEGKLWLSRQASEEFFRNRNKVIISANKTFKDAKEEIEKLRKSIEGTVTQLKGNRIIPADIADQMLEEISPQIIKAQERVEQAKNSHPNFLLEDSILDEVAKLFDGAIGRHFSTEEHTYELTEAERRKNSKIPPGYLDDDKDGERPYGDYFLWKQILNHSKESSQPILFVTSERKEDWWEKISGKTTGPRIELLREASEYTGQRILIYPTDRFLEFSSQRKGQVVNESAVEEIRAIDSLRTEREHAVEIISQKINIASPEYHAGEITIKLKRQVKNFTGSGHFKPVMADSPEMTVELISAPNNLPTCSIGSGTGTNYDFNIHVKSENRDELLPIGEYIFEYSATLRDESQPE